MYLFEIHQKPAVQKQTRLGRHGCYNPSHADQEMLRWQIRPHAPKVPLEGPISLEITFYMPIPKTSRVQTRLMINGTTLPIKRPDIDNMAYLVTNAMKGIMYEDDSQIVDLILRKRYGEEPKTVIKVIEL